MQSIKDFQHVAISVSDADRSLAFYRDLLGFPVLGRLKYPNAIGLDIDFLDIGGGHILEIFSFAVPVKPSEWLPNDLQTGLRHIGFKVRNVDEIAERLKAAGIPFTLEPFDAVGGVRIAFFKDPDGTLLEIVQNELQHHEDGPAAGSLPAVVPPPGVLVYDHVAITVSDLQAAKAYYTGLLEFPVIGRLIFNDERGFEITNVKAGSSVIELFSFSAPTIPAPWNPDETVLGLKHLGLLVDKVDPMADRLKAAGVRFISQPTDALGGVRTSFFYGPDDIALELIDGVCTYDE